MYTYMCSPSVMQCIPYRNPHPHSRDSIPVEAHVHVQINSQSKGTCPRRQGTNTEVIGMGFQPVTIRFLGQCSTNRATKAAQLAGLLISGKAVRHVTTSLRNR